MRFLFFELTSTHLLLCVFFNLLWAVTDGTTTSALRAAATITTEPPTATTTTTTTTPPPTSPPDVFNVTVGTQNETSITLLWDKVNNISTYRLTYNNTVKDIIDTSADPQVQYVVSDLTAGTEYNFTLFTTSNGFNSSGFPFSAVTAPRNPAEFKPSGQNESSITLKWEKRDEIDQYFLVYEEQNITLPKDSVQYTVSGLKSATRYNFSLFAVFKNIQSSGENISAVTAPLNPVEFSQEEQNETSVTLQWTQVTDINNYILNARGSEINVTSDNKKVTQTLAGLQSAHVYNVTLFAVFDYARSSGKQLFAVTAPHNPAEFKPSGQNESSITLEWEKRDEIDQYFLVYEEQNITLPKDSVKYTVLDLKNATRYNFSLFAAFKNIQSSGENISAVTAPRNPAQFRKIGQNESSITLEWIKQDEVHRYILEYEENKINITASTHLETHTVSGLQSASKYNFTLFAVFEYAKSSGKTITAVTAPKNPEEFSSIMQSETSITLQWKQVNGIKKYKIKFDKNETTVNATEGNNIHTIENLESGSAYNISLFALFKHVSSSGTSITAFTVPPQVSSVRVTERSVTSATLKWENPNKPWTYKVNINLTSELVIPDGSDGSGFVSYMISDLSPGTLYLFNVTTLFSGLNSTPYEGILVTQIKCEEIKWNVTNSSIQGTVDGLFSMATASNTSNLHSSYGGGNVLFNDLYPGATYEISLVYKKPSENLTQCASNPKVTTIPPLLSGSCKNQASGYSALVVWNNPEGVWTKVMINITDQSYLVDGNVNQFIISGLQPAKTYSVTLVSLSGERSSESTFKCATDNRGVIAGSVVGVLLFAVLVCMALFILLKRPDIIRGKKSFMAGVEKPATKRKVIPKANFPDHFTQLSADENRGFSEEYEALAPVGTEQTRKAATQPENKSKNRFTNILPYDWSRVKLITSSPDEILDYINANYMPGYNRNREYIASQGPLPNTVKDFWRMIWEQRVKAIVMVTNCIESGRTKCECYWPEDQKPCLYGELLVTLTSEQKEPNWTLREFRVEDRNDSEERTVKHFHFTAWPDHGVPQGTQILIQFRGLVRWFIESDGTKSPTVVHCSAGVGRTGTLIALDVLLQQLEKQGAVGINDFVHRMRQHRSHMVQTESQYVFLHQCIMDSLKQNEKQEENIYENSDMIYANATALREFHNHNT